MINIDHSLGHALRGYRPGPRPHFTSRAYPRLDLSQIIRTVLP